MILNDNNLAKNANKYICEKCAFNTSNKNNFESFFISRLADDGQVDYCKLYKNGSEDPYSDSLSNHDMTGEILDLTNVSGKASLI